MSVKKLPLNGKPASPPTEPLSANEIQATRKRLERLLAAVYNEYQRLDPPAVNAECRRDFVFHMMDWIEDLRQLADLYRHPEQIDRDQAEKIVSGFLIHVTAHVMEAARLMLNYEPGYIFDSPKPKKTPPLVEPTQHSAGQATIKPVKSMRRIRI